MSKHATSGKADVYMRIRTAWDDDAPSYDLRPCHGTFSDRERRAWRAILTKALPAARSPESLHVIDVGTGTGAMALLLAEMGHHVTGIDISEGMLGQARAKALRAGLKIDFLQANAAQLPFDPGTVDVVFSRHLFWTLPQPIRTLREWKRVVRPGGTVAVADGWWVEPGAAMRRRRAIGAIVRRILPPRQRDHPGYADLRDELPVAAGVSAYSIRYYLDQAGLERLKVTDLRAIRAAERHSLPPWYWIDRARNTWLATGDKPS
jgi:SAM-dependent methyltransferase